MDDVSADNGGITVDHTVGSVRVGLSIVPDKGLSITTSGLSVQLGSGLDFDTSGGLSVQLGYGLSFVSNELTFNSTVIDYPVDSVSADNGGITVDPTAGSVRVGLSIVPDKGLSITTSGLSVQLGSGLDFDTSGGLSVQLGYGLSFVSNELTFNSTVIDYPVDSVKC